MIFPYDMGFHANFFFFYVFIIDLLRCMAVSSYNDYLFVSFCVSTSNDSSILIKLRNHIKFDKV